METLLNLKLYAPGSLVTGFDRLARRWHVSHGTQRLKSWGLFDCEADALAAIARYFA